MVMHCVVLCMYGIYQFFACNVAQCNAMGVLYHDPSRSLNGKRKKFASTKDRLIDNSHTSAYMQQLLILYTVKGVKRHQGRKKQNFLLCALLLLLRAVTQ